MSTKTFKCELELGIPKISQHIQGGNSSVYKGQLPNGMTLAIKKYKGDKTREFTRLQANTVDYMVDISRMIGVPIVSNMFKQMKPLFSSVIDYVIYIKWLFILLVTIKGSKRNQHNIFVTKVTISSPMCCLNIFDNYLLCCL